MCLATLSIHPFPPCVGLQTGATLNRLRWEDLTGNKLSGHFAAGGVPGSACVSREVLGGVETVLDPIRSTCLGLYTLD